ncbi:4-alpha-glucanotransferase [Klebsiella pneumoniae]|nr:4-alpha-glucanotransferase [Klebsiella pneumoniae]
MAWKQFSRREDEQMAAFREFVLREGESLYWQAAFDALHAWGRYNRTCCVGASRPGRRPFRDIDSPEVKAFCVEHEDDASASGPGCSGWPGVSLPPAGKPAIVTACRSAFYRDLAAGVAEGGSETWCDRELYCSKASVGAPPDILGPLGQNWGLPPMDPHIIAARAYEPFIDLVAR